ncbi:MAG: S9 family peptidase [Anaerolinea sp.]|nr:S9 family peptidase [Anaerolinea sp.]
MMTPKQKRMYGTWNSPISPKLMGAARRFNDVQWDGDTLVWSETRGGQALLVAQIDGQAPRELTEPGMAVRGRVGYGGGEFTVHGGYVYFSADGRLWRQALSGGAARAITPAFGGSAAPSVSPDGKWIVYVLSYEGVDGLALVDTAGEQFPRKLAFGTDFVMQPTWSPDGGKIAYIAWDHPLMPWDGTQLRLAHVDRDHTGAPYAAMIETLVGGETVSVFQPQFSPDGKRLAYISDATGWNQVYVYDFSSGEHKQITDALADHGAPGWIQGLRVYAWTPDARALIYRRGENGVFSLWRVDLRTGKHERLHAFDAYTLLEQVSVSHNGTIALLGASSTIPQRVLSLGSMSDAFPQTLANYDAPGITVIVDAPGEVTIRARSSTENLTGLSVAQPMTFTADDGEQIYGLYYPPTSDQYVDPTGAPPLIVYVHGGPTSQARAEFNLDAQFFATRGIAYLAVNHRGSTGYGKDYMNKLRGAWGIYDVDDSANMAQRLVTRGLADPRRIVIKGGSAGGFTALYSLVKKPGFYRAAIASYAVADQFTTALDTHKFEERYSDGLVGELPDAADLYRERSPLFHADKISDPVLLFHGDQDNVVPISQAESIVKALRKRGVPHEYHVYAGEGHGWRKPETIEDYYTKVLAFLKQYVIFG